MKLLVVDDSSTMRRIIKNAFSRLENENIFESGNGMQAWKILNENLDIGMLITDFDKTFRFHDL